MQKSHGTIYYTDERGNVLHSEDFQCDTIFGAIDIVSDLAGFHDWVVEPPARVTSGYSVIEAHAIIDYGSYHKAEIFFHYFRSEEAA